MEEIKTDLVTEEVTENVEPTTEEVTEEAQEAPPKTYTEEEVNQIVGKKLARNTAKLTKKYDREYGQYGELVDVLKAGTGKENVSELTEMFREHYQGRGVNMSKKDSYSQKDIEILAKAEAEDIISGDIEDVIEEADRLKEIGVKNMSAKEKAVFLRLTEHIKSTEDRRELKRIGVTEEEYNGQEFREFASKFNHDTPITEIYKIYASTKPKKEYTTPGSMKNSASHQDSIVKEYYSPEEARKFTKAEFDKNPELFKAVQNSMKKWK